MIKSVLTIVFFLGLSSLAFAGELGGVEHNKEGIQLLKQENAAAAEAEFLNGISEDPFNPLLRVNLGFTFEAEKKYDKAQKEYEAVARDEKIPAELQFVGHFNAGNAAAQQKNIPEALAHYQAALDLQPNSKEVKTNIELLMKSGGGQDKKDGGGGSGNDKKDDKDGKGKDPNQSKDGPKDEPNPKPQFKSEKLTKEDVRKILEELKSQEQKIRALEYGSQGKEKSPEKDW